MRRKKGSLGAPKAITACAHKMARQIYRMLKFGEAYVEQGVNNYEKRYRERSIKNLKRRARALNMDVIPRSENEENLCELQTEMGS